MSLHEIVSAAEQVMEVLETDGHHVWLPYRGVSAGYCSDEATSATWITRFFGGYFLPSKTTEAQATLYSTGNAALFTLLQQHAAPRATSGKNQYVDSPLGQGVALIHSRSTKVVPEEDVFRLLFTRQRRILLVTSGSPEVRREEGMQTLRALSKWLLLERGWIPMHSACVAKGGRALCITGGKASGKTSTLLNLLARNRCDVLAIDKFLIRDAGSGVEICGLPGKIGVRVGTAVVQPKLLNWLRREQVSFFPHIRAEDVKRIAETNTPEELRTRPEKIHLLPTELASLFGTSITPTARLELVLIPVFDLGVTTSRLVRANPGQVLSMLLDCYTGLCSKGEAFLLHFFDLSDADLRERLEALLRRHLVDIPAYGLHQNHTTNEQSSTLVAALLKPGSGRRAAMKEGDG